MEFPICRGANGSGVCRYERTGRRQKIIVSDDGHVIDYKHVIPSFENLGGSWKGYETHLKGGDGDYMARDGKGAFSPSPLEGMVQW